MVKSSTDANTERPGEAMDNLRAGASYETGPGRPHPLGATVHPGGVNFAFFSQHATGLELMLFDEHDDPEPIQRIALFPDFNKTFHFWHVDVKGLEAGMHYAVRVEGPWALNDGHRYNRNKVLIDPYAKGNTNNLWDRGAACGPDENLARSMRRVVLDPGDFVWEGDDPLRRPMSETIVYEMHVGGFTRHTSAGVKNPGTFAAVIEKIPHRLKSLGVTADGIPAGVRIRRDRSASASCRTDGACTTSGATARSVSSRRTVRTASHPRRGRTSPSSATW